MVAAKSPVCAAGPPTDMVELMLMQNAQMHQIIMQGLMLKALPPAALQVGSVKGWGWRPSGLAQCPRVPGNPWL